MKPSLIRFFTPSDNVPRKGASPLANPKGYITTTGKLVFPPATLAELGIEANTSSKIGNDGKRKIDTLYLVPTEDPMIHCVISRP